MPVAGIAADAPFALDPQWLILPSATIASGAYGEPATTVDLALLHPARGIALYDILPKVTPDAVDLLQQTLDVARLSVLFPGYLPIIYRSISQSDLNNLAHMTEAAFKSEHQIDPFLDTAWTGLAAQALGYERPPTFSIGSADITAPQSLIALNPFPAEHRRVSLVATGSAAVILAALTGVTP